MATSAEYVDTIWYRITKGKPQPAAELWRVAVQSTLDAALQRLGDRVAADSGLFPLLMIEYDLTLVPNAMFGLSAVEIDDLAPVLLLSQPARDHWRVTMTNVRFSLKPLPTVLDMKNPPITPDFLFYTVYNRNLLVGDSTGASPSGTALQLFGNCTPVITDDVLDAQGQLFDNLIDIGIAIILESATLTEVIRQAETVAGTAPTPAAA